MNSRGKSGSWLVAGLMLVGILAGLAWSQAVTPQQQADAQKAVEQTFGKQIAQAKASADKADNLTLSKAILQASGDGATGLAVRIELAKTAMDVALQAGTPECLAVADSAANSYADLGKLSPAERCDLLVRVRTAQVAAAKPSDKPDANTALVHTIAELAAAYESVQDYDNAAASYARAIAAAKSVNLNPLADELSVDNARVTRLKAFSKDLADAKQELKAAQAGQNEPLVKEVNQRIGELYLFKLGDFAQAQSYLIKSGGDWAAGAAAVAKFNDKGQLTVDEYVLAAQTVKKAADRAELGPKSELMDLVVTICTAANAPAGSPQATQLDVLRQAAKAWLDKNPADKLAALRKALGNTAAALKQNADGSVTITYSFATAAQFKDWTAAQGEWSVDNGQLNWKGDRGDLFNNIRLRADKPVTVQIDGTVTAPGSIGCVLVLDKLDRYAGAYLVLNAHRQAGWETGGFNTKPTANQNPLPPGPYKLKITCDAGKIAYSLGGQQIATMQLPKDAQTAAGFRLGLNNSYGAVGNFRNVVITCWPITDLTPAASQPAPKPNPQPQPPQPPQPNPNRRPWGGGGGFRGGPGGG